MEYIIAIHKNDLIRNMAALGICEGDTLLVHSSMKSLGDHVEGGCATVIEALLTQLGINGTLLIPALSYTTVTRQSPFFSVNDTPSCIGKLSESFRLTPGIVRSVHPTHSVCAIGRLAIALTQDHIRDTTPVGANSPFRRMMTHGGKILMLGCGLSSNTFMHGVEEEAGVPYVLSPDPIPYTCELSDGQHITKIYSPHHFTGITQRYDRVSFILNDREMRQGKIAAANCYLLDSNALWTKALAKIKETSNFFVDCSK